MRRTWIGVVLLLIAVSIAVGIGAYNAGYSNGLESGAGEVVRVVGPGYGYHGFPFGLLLFPLFLFGIFFLIRGAFWARHGHPHGEHGWGPGWSRRNELFEEWHRHQHEEGDRPAGSGSGGEP